MAGLPMEPIKKAGVHPDDVRNADIAGSLGGDLPPVRAPFRVTEGEAVPWAVRRVGDAYWPAGTLPPEEPVSEPATGVAASEPSDAGRVESIAPPSPPVPVGPPSGATAVPPDAVVTAGASVPGAGTAPQAESVAGVASSPVVAGGSWGEAGGFPRPPKSRAEVVARGPIFVEALKDPLSIVMAVLLGGLAGGFGAYLGWRLGAEQEAKLVRGEAEKQVNAVRAESEARQKDLDNKLRAAEGRVADIARANAVLETQGRERANALAEARAASAALQGQMDALKKAQAEGEGAAGRVADLVTLRTEQERLQGLLLGAVGDTCEVGTDGPYVFVRPKVPLYGEGSGKPAEAVVDAMKKVAGVVKAYDGPYRLHVEGHTDASPGPTVAGQGSNLYAGAMRALEIAQVFADAGIPASKMALLSEGEAFPRRAGKDAESVKVNRRVELVFAPSRKVEIVAAEVSPPGGGAGTAAVPKAVPVKPETGAQAQSGGTTSSAPPAAAREPAPVAPAVIKAETTREGAQPTR